MRTLTTMAAGVALGASLVTGSLVYGAENSHPAHHATVAPPARAPWMIRTCQTEDTINCARNARRLGNGHGHSFYRVRRPLENTHGKRVGTVVCVFYVTHVDIRRWDACHILPAGQNGSLR